MKNLLVIIAILFSSTAYAAVGCDLNDPDRDVRRFFPDSTGYRTEYRTLEEARIPEVEKRLGDKFSGLYETADVPYTVYTILRGERVIGYIHGINQKGKFGGLQVFLALDPQGAIRDFYYQKLTSRNAKDMRSPDFAARFKGLKLADFKPYDPASGTGGPKGIVVPDSGDDADFRATLRAVKKNLILMDVFVFNEGVDG